MNRGTPEEQGKHCMSKYLVIVESPAKAKTINKILGSDFVVKACLGHVRDLPVSALSVDVEKGFKPKYALVQGKAKVIAELKQYAAKAEMVYLAPDPDREGEAIAWHLREVLKAAMKDRPFVRVQYNEITPAAVRKAFDAPGEIDLNRVNAQQARRILDRIVGYMVSPLLWRRVGRGLSAGRVQSVALRLLCEREAEIRAFVAEAFWLIGAKVRKEVEPLDPFRVKLIRVDGGKVDIKTVEQAEAIRAELDGRAMVVSDIGEKEMMRRAFPPLITSTLQQAGSSQCGLSPQRTMSIAQKLYEGLDFGEGPVGLITYMRTDSVSISVEAAQQCREFVVRTFGDAYYPEKPNMYRSKSSAQGAHEAIRPTDVNRTPEKMAAHLGGPELRIYTLIWKRFVASQMAPARIAVRTVKVDASPRPGQTRTFQFQASSSDVKFAGYMKVSGVDVRPEKGEDDAPPEQLPPLAMGERLECLEWLSERKETQPPPRYSEASLVKALESNGIGRPSTYAQILGTLNQRGYVKLEKRTLFPSALGEKVSTFLVGNLDSLFNVKFTAQMEEALDRVEEGSVEWHDMLQRFYTDFQDWMKGTAEPPVDEARLGQVLDALGKVVEWAPAVQTGRSARGDEQFVASVRKQIADGKRAVSQRQMEALLRLVARYMAQVEGSAELLKQLGRPDLLDIKPPSPPSEADLKKLGILEALELDDRTKKFVASLRRQTGQRGLSEAQSQALDRIVLRNSGAIPDFESVSKDLGLGAAAASSGETDHESAGMLAAFAAVNQWKDAVKRGRRVFDDKAFYESLSRQFSVKRQLSPKQKAALRKMGGRYGLKLPPPASGADTVAQ